MRKKKLLQGAKLSKYLDGLIREYFKIKYGENPSCFVCGRMDGWFHPQKVKRGIQVGHYISRTWNILRWDLVNVYPQCSGCNRIHNQNPAPFTLAIINAYGKGVIECLNEEVKKARGTKMPVSAIRQVQVDLEDLISGSL